MNQNDDYMNEVLYHNNVYIVNTGFRFKMEEKVNILIGIERNFMKDEHSDSSKAYGTVEADSGGIQEPALATASAAALSSLLSFSGVNFNRDLAFKKETWVTAVGV